MDIKDYGYKGETAENGAQGIPARITATHRDRYEIVCSRGAGSARLKIGTFYDKAEAEIPTTGDFVMLDWNESGESRILELIPRKTFFARKDPSYMGKREQLVAANFDYVFIFQSLNRDFNIKRLERYLTLSWQSGATPVVVLTKLDVNSEYYTMLVEAEAVAAGAEVIAVSAVTREGLDRLSPYLQKGKTLVFLGSSGVGKSSLVNALAGEEIMSTAEIRQDDQRGRHTTTHRELIMMPSGAMIIDTPGMRELGMWDVSEGLDKSFSDVEQYLGQCRFSNCTHRSEPGCAIREAINAGELSEERWQRYQGLMKEARYAESPDQYLIDKTQRYKQIAKLNKTNKKR